MQTSLRIGVVVLASLGIFSAHATMAQSQSRRDDRDFEFGKRRHMVKLSDELYSSANALCWEIHRNYNNNTGYQKSYRKAYQLLQDSKNIRELAKGNRRFIRKDDELEQDLRNSDRLFHELEREVAGWRPDSRRRSGSLPSDLDRYEEALHHMMRDYGVASRYERRHADRPRVRR